MSTSSPSSAWQIELLFGPDQQPLTYLQAVWLDTKSTVNQIPVAKIVLSAPGGTSADLKALSEDAERCEPGTSVVINIKSGQSQTMLFSGMVQQQSYGAQMGHSELTLKLRHPLHKLVATHRNQLFEQMSDKQILQQLLQDHQIPQGESLSGLAVVHPQMVQFDCSDWQFIKARLNANGVWFLPEASGGVSVTPPTLSGEPQHTLYQSQSMAQTGDTEPLIEEAYWQFNGMEQPGKLAVTSWDIKQQAMAQSTQSTSCSVGAEGLDPGRFAMPDQPQWLLTSSLSLMPDESKALVDSRYLALQAKGVQACFTLAGDAAYQLGETLALSGFGQHFNGKGVISSVQHKLSRGNWRTVVTLGQDTLNEVDETLLPSITGLQVGIVEEYEEDPGSLNRLRVKVPAVGDKSLWARFAMPYASKDSGLCLYPEPGDEVVLGFFAQDPRYPVILGAMHNPQNTAPFVPSEANNKKGLILVKDGNTRQLLFDTEEGSLSLQYDKDHLQFKAGIELSSDQDAELSCNNLKISTTKNMTLKSNEKFEVSAKTLSATGNDSVKVQGNAIELG
ncbi:Rhs element Vgr protein [Pseudomonas fluorescens]|uniref:type VI secretion system tip protein VgrG n=1 Tax=Pseudomonas fluorescens TaxID=294 RepID=UPI00209F8F65|nr:type VI secretion system tip protein VgrG [Pseudomonas fluorescens]MCP1489808.1 Rhs element Vgr protein [Pseudomonas fluorescens]